MIISIQYSNRTLTEIQGGYLRNIFLRKEVQLMKFSMKVIAVITSMGVLFFLLAIGSVKSQPGLVVKIPPKIFMDSSVSFSLIGQDSGNFFITFNEDISPTLFTNTPDKYVELPPSGSDPLTPCDLWLRMGENTLIASHKEFTETVKFTVNPSP